MNAYSKTRRPLWSDGLRAFALPLESRGPARLFLTAPCPLVCHIFSGPARTALLMLTQYLSLA